MTYNKKSIGPVFQFILWLLLFFVICIVGISNVFGLETKTIYSNQTLDNSNKFNYGFVNEGGIDSITIGNVGSRISGKTKYINFYLSQNVALNYTYTIRINFLADDVQPYFSLNHVKEISVCNSSSCSNSSIVSIKKQNNNGFSTWIELTFNPTQVGNVIGVTLGDNHGSYITGETFFGISSVQIESKNANQDVIDNATNNTNNIINNNNSNTDSIINSNKETQEVIKDQFNTCYTPTNIIKSLKSTSTTFIEYFLNKDIDYTKTIYLNLNSDIPLGNTAIIFYYASGLAFSAINVNLNTSNSVSFTLTQEQISLLSSSTGNYPYLRLYRRTGNSLDFTNVTISNIALSNYNVAYDKYGKKICTNKIDETNTQLGNLNDSLNNSDSSGATSEASEFFSGFTTDTFGLTSIITAPLNLIGSITSSTCTPLGLPLPFVNKTLELPCMSSIYSQYFGSFFTLYQTITFGIIAYWVCVRIFNLVKDFKNPDHDEIEVLDL